MFYYSYVYWMQFTNKRWAMAGNELSGLRTPNAYSTRRFITA